MVQEYLGKFEFTQTGKFGARGLRREKIIQQIYMVECTQRYSKHVKCRLERFKRPAAVKPVKRLIGRLTSERLVRSVHLFVDMLTIV